MKTLSLFVVIGLGVWSAFLTMKHRQLSHDFEEIAKEHRRQEQTHAQGERATEWLAGKVSRIEVDMMEREAFEEFILKQMKVLEPEPSSALPLAENPNLHETPPTVEPVVNSGIIALDPAAEIQEQSGQAQAKLEDEEREFLETHNRSGTVLLQQERLRFLVSQMQAIEEMIQEQCARDAGGLPYRQY